MWFRELKYVFFFFFADMYAFYIFACIVIKTVKEMKLYSITTVSINYIRLN